jgi:hypothetical protein
VPAQRLVSGDAQHATLLLDPHLDHSYWTPHTLHLLTDLAARLPFEEAALVARNFGLQVTKSDLERLSAPVAKACQDVTFDALTHAQPQPERHDAPSRVMVLEVDGVNVLTKPSKGACAGLEIKTVTLYAYASPSERVTIADVRHPATLKAAIQGLLHLSGVTPVDTLVGVGDGAAWVEDVLDHFCDVSITDCFHAAEYLEQLMLALGWDEARRTVIRRAFCRGEIDMRGFLQEHLPSPEVWLAWAEEALVALRYLEQRVARMRYPSFKQRGFPIGSGVIEGLNKSVIGSRMKRSGMQWSRPGAARMAALRAWVTSKRKLVTFDAIRQVAYPPPSLEALESSP